MTRELLVIYVSVTVMCGFLTFLAWVVDTNDCYENKVYARYALACPLWPVTLPVAIVWGTRKLWRTAFPKQTQAGLPQAKVRNQ